MDDARQLRNAFGSFATGVAIVTALSAGERIGATVSSFNSVSLAPPLVSFSIARNAKAFQAWESAPTFGVSILSTAQADLSTRFARSLGDKWTGVSLLPASRIDAPLVDGALMWFECEAYGRHDGGDHLILIGRVLAARRNCSANPAPLVFFGGAYRHLAPPRGSEFLTQDAMWLHGW
ncbi:MAG: hypothetical protein BGP06_04820 [Rhizobiales bacterium 65-9]|nr:MAG: hypothetical protein BGP06_04820 [Rhizobiales bacterium 65-9]